MYENFKSEIVTQTSALLGVSADIIEPAIEVPKVATLGDLALTVPRLRLKGNPVQLAQKLASEFAPSATITAATAAGPYVNFRIDRTTLTRSVLQAVHSAGPKYGWTNEGAGKRVIVEYSSPNIAKPFHAGHLRSTIIGNFIYKLYKANGWEAIGMNYLGDWGKQYGLLAIGFERFGSEEQLKADPIKHLYEVYVQINKAAEDDPTIHDAARAYFKQMEDGDKQVLGLWERFRSLSIEKYKDIYAHLGVHFDVYSGESQVGEGMERAMKMLEDAHMLVEDNDAKLIDLTKYKLGNALVQKSDGTSLYLTRDIGAAIERYETYNFDKIIYVIGSAQVNYMRRFFKTLELINLPYADRFQHVSFGQVQGMSTRKGTAVFLEDMLTDSKEKMHEVMCNSKFQDKNVADPEHTAAVLGMSAIVIQDLSAKRIKNYEFDWGRILNFEGDTGPYIQYQHTRMCSLERKAHVGINLDADVSLLTEDVTREIVNMVSQYPDVLALSFKSLEPCNIVQYLLKLSRAVSSAWQTIWVDNQPKELAEARLLMYSSARIVISNGLTLLGLEPIERM
ncbi:arginyl-tRNA synthetase [Coemansia sp. RSA 2336]|nr:arginyl-tRNA synthetase [Coemansia sp. RSA 2336]